MASKRARQLVHQSLKRVDHKDLSDCRRRVAIRKSEFTRELHNSRKHGWPIYLDQYGRCYLPASSAWLHELDVANDQDVQHLQLQVMLVDNESSSSSSPTLIHERRNLLLPGDMVELRAVVTKRTDAERSVGAMDMRVFSVHGHTRSRCYIVYLQDVSD